MWTIAKQSSKVTELVLQRSATRMSLQGRASCPAAASDVIRHLQGLLLLQRAASHLKLDLTLLRSSRIQQLTQGKEGQTILFQTKTTLKDILISYLLLGSVETVVQICRALQSLLYPGLLPSSLFYRCRFQGTP